MNRWNPAWHGPRKRWKRCSEARRRHLAVFTPRRWDLLAVPREGGPMTIAELDRRLKRDYKNVHGDVEKLAEWQAIEKDEKKRVVAPYSEIVVDVRLPQYRSA
ncbi:MAG: HVO_A0114 family putative DNA-binding protein [Sulfuricella sp.]